ncbi:MAG: preprotein translocase subunit YajC [Pseudomonadales bacterium]
MSFFIPSAMAQSGAEGPPPGADMFQFAFLIGLFVLFYFIAIRPQRKRQKEHDAMVSALKKGDEVVMTSGMLGKIIDVEDNYATVKVADNVELKFQRVSVHAILPKGTLKSVQ